MIVTIVRFAPSEQPLTANEARELFLSNAASYLDVPGLACKAYLRSDDGLVVGGCYWWTDRASAEARFNADWLAGVTEKYGTAPTIEWFDAPVIVDGRAGEVIS